MKKGVFRSLALLFISGLAIAQPSVRSVDTITIDSFDTVGEQKYQKSGTTYNWTWGVQASRFVAEGYPKLDYFDAIPNSLRVLRNEGDPDPKVIGVKTKFDRKGDNWFEVFPLSDQTDEDGNPKALEIPFIGHVNQIDMWVWGANYAYNLEILVRDAEGRVHSLPAGSLQYYGWRNLVVKIPTYIRQASRLRSGPETLSFVGFRVRSDFNEYVDDYIIYIDQLRYVSSTLSSIYDGYELRKIQFPGEEEGAAAGGQGGGDANAQAADANAQAADAGAQAPADANAQGGN